MPAPAAAPSDAPRVPAPWVPSPRRPSPGSGRRGPGELGRFLPAVPEIVRAALVRVEAGLPELATAPWRSRSADEAFLRFELARRLERCEQGTGFDDADLARFAGHFTAMARRGAPLPTLQRFCRAAVVDTSIELWARAEPADVPRLLALSRWLSWQLGAVERLLVRAYEELADPHRVARCSALAERLLAGSADRTGEDEPEARLAPGYLVVATAAPVDPADLPAGTLSTTAGGRAHLLLPVGPDRAAEQAWTDAATWVGGRAGLLAAGAFAAAPSRVPSAAAAADALVGAAAAVGLPPRLVGEQDLVLETALSARREGLRRLSAVLDPLDAHPRLVRTLTTFLGHDLDRTRTADALALSRGGLSLRLDRIAQLTRLDPRSTRGIQVLTTALTARALLRAADLER